MSSQTDKSDRHIIWRTGGMICKQNFPPFPKMSFISRKERGDSNDM